MADRRGRQRVDLDLKVLNQIQVATPDQAWSSTNGSVETMPSSEATALRRIGALLFIDPFRGRSGATVTLRPRERRGGREWAVVRLQFGDADAYDAFIDPKSGELTGFRIEEDRQQRWEGLGDWRLVSGVRVPFLKSVTGPTPGDAELLKLDAVTLNSEVGDARFASPPAVRKLTFANGASDTGWIPFDFFQDARIFFSARINGRETVVLLDSGASISAIDKAYAAEIGVKAQGAFSAQGSGGAQSAGFAEPLTVEIGDAILQDVRPIAIDTAALARSVGRPLPFILGHELFDHAVVDIDFAGRRLAIRGALGAKPPRRDRSPLMRLKQNRSVPVSVEGDEPVPFEFDLGNSSYVSVYPAYAKLRNLLSDRRTSQMRAGGVGGSLAAEVSRIVVIE